MERGTLIHYVLEKLLSEVGTKQLPDYDRKQITALVDGYIEQYFKEEMGDPSDMPSRFRYNFRRLSKMLVDVVCRLAGEWMYWSRTVSSSSAWWTTSPAPRPFVWQILLTG